MRREIISICLLWLVAPSALAQPVFNAYVARDARREGDGGERRVVDNMEIWSNGSPPRRWEIIGYISDRRHSSGLFGAIRMSTRDQEIVAAARANGGDAVILVDEQNHVVGHTLYGNAYTTGSFSGSTHSGAFSGMGSANTSSWGHERPVANDVSRYAVIRWLDAANTVDQPADVKAKP